MTVTHRSDVEGVSSSATTEQAKRPGWFWALMTVLGIVVIAAIAVVAIVIGTSVKVDHAMRVATAPTTAPTGGNTVVGPNQAPTGQAGSQTYYSPTNTAPPTEALVLPTESESDSPQTVANYMDGPNGIFVNMYATGNQAYLSHYYAIVGMGGYTQTLSDL